MSYSIAVWNKRTWLAHLVKWHIVDFNFWKNRCAFLLSHQIKIAQKVQYLFYLQKNSPSVEKYRTDIFDFFVLIRAKKASEQAHKLNYAYFET